MVIVLVNLTAKLSRDVFAVLVPPTVSRATPSTSNPTIKFDLSAVVVGKPVLSEVSVELAQY